MNHYSEQDSKAQMDATVVNVTEIFEESSPHFGTAQRQVAEEITRVPEQDEAPIITLVNKILILGMQEKASEIHLEPEESKLNVRIRQGGNLRLLFDPLPKKVITPVINRLKGMVGLDITKTKTPQKGRLRKSYNHRPIYFFVHTLPSFYGEKIVVRIVESLTELPNIETLIPDDATQKLMKGLNQRKSGLILVTGPAHSGISTTLEAFLHQQQKQERIITTIEDPIRRTFPGITQVEINLDQDFTYEKALRSLEKQGIDVISVDQIEDDVTAQAVLKAVNQGHLVLTSLSAKDSVSAIAQLSRWVESSDLAESLAGVVNQRLLRRVCPTCRLVHQSEKHELQQLALSPKQHQSSTFYRANTLNQELIKQFQLKGRLCRQCNGAGYHGQVGIYEVLSITPALRSLIHRGAEADALRKTALEGGMKTLVKAALDQVLQGTTTLEEFFRVFPDALTVLTQVQAPVSLSPDFQKRLTDLERSLSEVNKAFTDLKQALNLTVFPEIEEFIDESDEFSPQTQPLSHPAEAEIDLSEVTLVSDTQFYEELANPGKWPSFRKEINSPKSAIADNAAKSRVSDLKSELAKEDFLLPDDQEEADKTVIAPFKSVVDPW